jgi:hypothetical protein
MNWNIGLLKKAVVGFLWIGGLTLCGGTNLFSQTPATETRSGCLTSGGRTDQFLLIDEVTGQRLVVTGTNLNQYASGGGSRVNATGTMVRPGIFQITNVQQTRDFCGPIGFSLAALRDEIGRATVGIRVGMGIDPEIITVGAQAQLGPVFQSVWFRPTTEFGFGEVTKVYSLNGDFVYYLPYGGQGADLQNRWNTYAGAGPAFTILRRDFGGFPDQPLELDDDWDSEFGVNFLFGVVQSSGLFIELRASAYNTPAVRFYVGYTFR